MHLLIPCLLFLLGLLLIVKGGNWFVDAAAWIAEAFGLPPVVVGATIVSIATTLPEILVSVMASLSGKADMAVGNAVGSVTVNIGVIFALCALLAPCAFHRREYAFKGVLMVVAVGALLLFTWRDGRLQTPGAVVLIVIFALFLYENIRQAQDSLRAEQAGVAQGAPARVRPGNRLILRKGLDFAVGTLGLVGGARLLVDNGSLLALGIGVPESIVGVTVIAFGTSLPELVTAITAIVKKQSALSIGNILGANIIDTTLIVPLCGLLAGEPLAVSAQGLALDLPFCLLIAIACALPMLLLGRTTRRQGGFLLALYSAYIVLLIRFIA